MLYFNTKDYLEKIKKTLLDNRVLSFDFPVVLVNIILQYVHETLENWLLEFLTGEDVPQILLQQIALISLPKPLSWTLHSMIFKDTIHYLYQTSDRKQCIQDVSLDLLSQKTVGGSDRLHFICFAEGCGPHLSAVDEKQHSQWLLAYDKSWIKVTNANAKNQISCEGIAYFAKYGPIKSVQFSFEIEFILLVWFLFLFGLGLLGWLGLSTSEFLVELSILHFVLQFDATHKDTNRLWSKERKVNKYNFQANNKFFDPKFH